MAAKWFGQLCRNLGLTVHNIRHPDGQSDAEVSSVTGETDQKPEAEVKEISRKVEEKQDGTVILRRTTIEEIEYRPDEQDTESIGDSTNKA